MKTVNEQIKRVAKLLAKEVDDTTPLGYHDGVLVIEVKEDSV